MSQDDPSSVDVGDVVGMGDRQQAADVLRRLVRVAERGDLTAPRRMLDALIGAAVGLETQRDAYRN